MARAPSNPQRNIESQELQELQEFRSCRMEVLVTGHRFETY